MSFVQLSLDELKNRAADVLISAGAEPSIAASVALALVLAEADGHAGHGLIRLANYAAQVVSGKIDGRAQPALKIARPGVAQIDAAYGFAYPALDLAIEWILATAPSQGVAVACVTRSSHCGAMGLVVERIARANLVGLMFANTPAAMAPWGGRSALLGTNPIACAFPFKNDPVVVDMSLSKVARGHILAAKQSGSIIPDDWALGPDGAPTTNPNTALAGTMRPVGDAKGAALAVVVEALAAGITGSHYAAEASSFLDSEGPPSATGQLLIAIEPVACGGDLTHLASLFEAIAHDPGARLAGLSRFERRRHAELVGLQVDIRWFDR
jgi:(2R)-3-sulfolactate dehydrogenase (NADP+)